MFFVLTAKSGYTASSIRYSERIFIAFIVHNLISNASLLTGGELTGFRLYGNMETKYFFLKSVIVGMEILCD